MRAGFSLSAHIRAPIVAFAAFVCALVATGPSGAQVAELELKGAAFHEPSSVSAMTVYMPGASLVVRPWEFLSLSAAYEADIVSGASEPVKAGPLSDPDIISQASVVDTRHVVSGGFQISRKLTTLSATYSYGTERDYKSQAISVAASTEFLQRNTKIDLSYSRGFDKVCNAAYPATRDPTLRAALDSSTGCFTDDVNRQTQDIDLDTFGAGWTQSWTPVFTTQLVLTTAIQHGFLGNPYRGVVITSSGQVAQEHHPDDRARFAGALRAKYYIRGLETRIGGGVRGYKDTWDILSQTYELDAERYIFPWLRLFVHGRYYQQTGALFWSDDYTGGEPTFGPRGQYWSGDRETSPMKSYLLGGRVIAGWKGTQDARLAGILLDLELGGNLDIIKTQLEDFTLAGEKPDDTLAFVLGFNLRGGF